VSDPKNDWPLVDPLDDGILFAKRGSRHCHYCKQKIGEPHARDCDAVKKVARVRCIVEVDIYVPHWFSKEDIEENECVRWEVKDYVSPDGDCDLVGIELMSIIDETPVSRSY
jgi:hypothetical protein